jgi:hypothetical protein
MAPTSRLIHVPVYIEEIDIVWTMKGKAT